MDTDHPPFQQNSHGQNKQNHPGNAGKSLNMFSNTSSATITPSYLKKKLGQWKPTLFPQNIWNHLYGPNKDRLLTSSKHQ